MAAHARIGATLQPVTGVDFRTEIRVAPRPVRRSGPRLDVEVGRRRQPDVHGRERQAAALVDLACVEAQLVELRLRVMADAQDIAPATASSDVAGWLAASTRCRPEDARADLRLATALDRRWEGVASGLREGAVNRAQASVVVGALEQLPSEVPADVVRRAESTLVAHCATFGPRQLHRLGRRILDVVAPDIAEAAEAKRLAALESEARRRTRLTLRRCGDGTTRVSGRIPDAAATRLATYLEAFASPRNRSAADAGAGDPLRRLPYPRRLGEALCQFLEAVDPARLPLHGGDATTVIVSIDLASLRSELGSASLLGAGSIPGDHGSPDDHITAHEARRLACNARIVPAVLGGRSEVLDLGRARRLFSAAQRKALLVRDRTCRAEHCDIPGTWAEAHHWVPWQAGGETDMGNAVLLCSHHHHRAHDPVFDSQRLASGDVRFNRRT